MSLWLLNVQVAALVGIGLRQLFGLRELRARVRDDQERAIVYRQALLELQDAQLDADLATWARLAGRTRSVLAGESEERKRDQNGQSDEIGESWIQSEAHPSIVQTGADV